MNALRDHHGRIINATDYSIIAHFTASHNIRYKDERTIDSEIWNSVQDASARFEFELLDDQIGYLKVVGIGPNVDGQAEAERIYNAIISLSNKNVKEWILDLRYNGGGNANVMLSGLAPLLNSSQIASVQNLNGTILGRAEIIDGNYRYFGYEAYSIANNQAISTPKIAVLTSRYTASSGELVAVAFKGQEHVRFFGEATGGYTTNTSAELIHEAVYLVIATGIFADRNGHAYPENVPTDVNINFEVETDKLKDAGIIAAKAWLIED
jgi:C-terminal processing protease CtpA/Prc